MHSIISNGNVALHRYMVVLFVQRANAQRAWIAYII